jgi:hypothetical protein
MEGKLFFNKFKNYRILNSSEGIKNYYLVRSMLFEPGLELRNFPKGAGSIS